jgi:polysaccharide biosynthesis protein PslJ
MSVVLARIESAIFSPDARTANLALAVLIVSGACLAALAVALAGPVVALAVFLAVPAGLLMLRDLRWGFVALFAVLGLLPFATLPFKLGFTPTLLDLALLALYFVWIMRIATRRQSALTVSVLAAPVLVFVLLAIFAFANGLQYSLPTPAGVRNFAELILGILCFFLVINNFRAFGDVKFLAQVIIVAGAAAAVIAIVLYVIPTTWTIRVLDSLTRFNYPGGAGALRYIDDDPANAMRAIGTQVDPNVLGGFLILVAGLTIPQVVSRRPLLPRAFVTAALGLEVLALYFTHSRGSMVGLAGALLLIGLLRYRKLLLLLAAGLALLLLLPQAQAYVAHFVEGIQLQDRATLMRLGEYKDALTLINRYPWFGVGFTGSPDASLYIGVSSLYLLMAEEMGLVGLGCFVVIMIIFVASLWSAWRNNQAGQDPEREALLLGVGGAILAALIGGFFDHYLFNLVYPHMSTLFWILLGLGITLSYPAPVPAVARIPG